MCSLGAGAEDFTNAIHAYLEQFVHAQVPHGCIVVGQGNLYGTTILGGEKAHLAGAAFGTIFRFSLKSEEPSQK